MSTSESKGPDPVAAHDVVDDLTAVGAIEERAERSEGGGRGGRFAIVLAVALLLAYPAGRWIMSRGDRSTQTKAGPASDLQRSFELYEAGKYEEAVEIAKSVIAAHPDSADAYNNLAVSYMRLGRHDDAIAAALEALRLRPDYQLAKNNLAWFQREKTAATESVLPPDDAKKLSELLQASAADAAAQRYEECIAKAKDAASIDPTSGRAFNNIGFCSARLKRWDDAIRNTEEAIRLDPTLDVSRNNLRWMLEEKRKADSVSGQ